MMAWGDFNLSKGFNSIHYMIKVGDPDPDTTHNYLQSDINIVSHLNRYSAIFMPV